MQIIPHCVVTIRFILRLDDESVVEEATETEPFTFILGIEQTIPGLDQNLLGLTTGDNFEFMLEPDEAFGEKDETLIIDVPIENFSNAPEGTLELNKSIPMLDSEGNTIFGVVVGLDETNATMDFNHPLAGERLYFKGKILGVRKALASELEMGRTTDNLKDGFFSDN